MIQNSALGKSQCFRRHFTLGFMALILHTLKMYFCNYECKMLRPTMKSMMIFLGSVQK